MQLQKAGTLPKYAIQCALSIDVCFFTVATFFIAAQWASVQRSPVAESTDISNSVEKHWKDCLHANLDNATTMNGMFPKNLIESFVHTPSLALILRCAQMSA